jgi:small subunit ribosomal protein S8
MLTDPIADLLTRIRNAYLAKRAETTAFNSKINEAVVKILVANGYLEGYSIETEAKKKILKIELKYNQGKAAMSMIKRISRPGRRVYQPFPKLPRVLNGLGMAIVSTSKGVMTANSAKKERLGGELICQVW